MINMILNLEKDFSSIHQEKEESDDFSKESIYGLSDLKKKSEKNSSRIELKPKEKNIFVPTHLFGKKLPHHFERSANSTSKNSGKSISIRRNKKGLDTPDNHKAKNKSKSTTKKNIKVIPDRKSKLTDTEKLYYEEGGEREEKEVKEVKLVVRESRKG